MAILIHLGLENVDKIEGRGPEIPKVAFLDHCILDMWVNEDPSFRSKSSVKVYSSWEECRNDSKDKVRQRALKKLTEEEREALGL